MINPVGRRLWTRWYVWIVYLAVLLVVAGGLVSWVAAREWEARAEAVFVVVCLEGGESIDLVVSARLCSCVWDDLRRDHSADEILDRMSSGHWAGGFEERFLDSFFRCL